MKVHRLEQTQLVRSDLAHAWQFFSSPQNLPKITPPQLGFEILSPLPPEIYAGLFIEYRVRPLFGVPMTWVSEITQVRAPHFFCDEQRVGPYAIWHHEHHLTEQADGQVEVRDLIHYALPFSPFSEFVHPFLVAPQLREIFAHRQRVLSALFPA